MFTGNNDELWNKKIKGKIDTSPNITCTMMWVNQSSAKYLKFVFKGHSRDVDKFENRRKFCKNRRKGRRRYERPQDARGGG